VAWRSGGCSLRKRQPLSAALAVAAALLIPSAAQAQSPGAPGSGDPYFPLEGNGGYEVDHYDLQISYGPPKNRLRGVATIQATSTQALSAFNLDLLRLRVSGVTVDGAPAALARHGGELVIAPATPIASGSRFTVVVAYAGKPKPRGHGHFFPTGWTRTRDAAYAFSEPIGAPTWFPCNDHPSDKATYAFTVTVPRRYRAIANGLPQPVERHRGSATYRWSEEQPMTTYLATVAIGHFRLKPSRVEGIQAWTAVVPSERRFSKKALRRLPRILRFLTSRLGPYPFSSTGSVVVTGSEPTALETQTRPVYVNEPIPEEMAHELAHQWFGDAVSIERWSDIWLNEGFATWVQWMWAAGGSNADLRETFDAYYDTSKFFNPDFWKVPPAAPGPQNLFGEAVYFRGGMTLEALREMIGDATFYSILHDWVGQHLYGNATTEEFIALAEAESGRSLSRFFNLWLYQPGKPVNWTS
jgi:aminopeptidase N